MNRWLKNDTGVISDPERPRFRPEQLRVFSQPPMDAINDIVHERFRPAARLELPISQEVTRAWWAEKSSQLRQQLLERCFRGWPSNPPDLQSRPVEELTRHGVCVRNLAFVSEDGVPLNLWLVQAEKTVLPSEVLIHVCDEPQWQQWLADLGPDFAEVLHRGGNLAPRPYPEWQPARLAQHRAALAHYGWAFAIVTPRGVGVTRWSDRGRFDGQPVDQHIRRRFFLLGQTLEGQQVWDIRRAIQVLAGWYECKKVPMTVQARGISAGLALYAALFEPAVTALELRGLPVSHKEGPAFLQVLTILDMPQAVALALPRRVTLHTEAKQARAWDWPLQLQKALGGDALRVRE